MHRDITHRTGNRILDLLPERERDSLLSLSEVVSLEHAAEVYPLDGAMSHVYFPARGVLSELMAMRDGKRIEAATIGNDGMAGVHVYLRLDFCPLRIVSQIPGEIFRVPTPAFRQAVAASEALDRLMRHYASFALRSAHQIVACNALHSSQQRVCRWLLMVHDRAGADEFFLTHEFLAEMLGMRRQTVTVLAGLLQKQELIRYRRGAVQILNRIGLEAASCECYSSTRSLYERIVQ